MVTGRIGRDVGGDVRLGNSGSIPPKTLSNLLARRNRDSGETDIPGQGQSAAFFCWACASWPVCAQFLIEAQELRELIQR